MAAARDPAERRGDPERALHPRAPVPGRPARRAAFYAQSRPGWRERSDLPSRCSGRSGCRGHGFRARGAPARPLGRQGSCSTSTATGTTTPASTARRAGGCSLLPPTPWRDSPSARPTASARSPVSPPASCEPRASSRRQSSPPTWIWRRSSRPPRPRSRTGRWCCSSACSSGTRRSTSSPPRGRASPRRFREPSSQIVGRGTLRGARRAARGRERRQRAVDRAALDHRGRRGPGWSDHARSAVPGRGDGPRHRRGVLSGGGPSSEPGAAASPTSSRTGSNGALVPTEDAASLANALVSRPRRPRPRREPRTGRLRIAGGVDGNACRVRAADARPRSRRSWTDLVDPGLQRNAVAGTRRPCGPLHASQQDCLSCPGCAARSSRPDCRWAAPSGSSVVPVAGALPSSGARGS